MMYQPMRCPLMPAMTFAVKSSQNGVFFNPLSLFAAGEQGAWYDPSDLTTLFQDSAGTTPVTALEQPVGLMLDKRLGLVLGSELVTNGDFSSGTTGWSASNGSITNSAGKGLFTKNAVGGAGIVIGSALTTEIGKTYVLRGTYEKGTTTTNGFLWVSNNSDGSAYYAQSTNADGQLVVYFRATATTTYVGVRSDSMSANTTYFADNISVRELPGNHAFQSTAASRPVLSARYNLLTKTEQFDDAAWTKAGASVSTNPVNAPNGTLTADKLVEDHASLCGYCWVCCYLRC